MDHQRLEDLLAAMARLGASALHLVPGRAPALRLQRRFVHGDEATVQKADVDEMMRDLLFADHRAQLAERGHVEVLYVARSRMRYRAAIAQVAGQSSVVLRPLPVTPPQLGALDLPSQVAGFAQARSGLVLVVGFPGAGKSTTLGGIVDALNQDAGRHVVTIEQRITFVHQLGPALLHQREVGKHVATAALGIRQAMAAGADVIVVDALVDRDALLAATAAAESGCLVLAGVEAGSITGALGTLVGMATEDERPALRTALAAVLRGGVAQRLLPRAHRPGRVPVAEVLLCNGAARAAIRDGDFAALSTIMQKCRGLGMQTADEALRALLDHHVISADEALLHAQDRDAVLAGARPGR